MQSAAWFSREAMLMEVMQTAAILRYHQEWIDILCYNISFVDVALMIAVVVFYISIVLNGNFHYVP